MSDTERAWRDWEPGLRGRTEPRRESLWLLAVGLAASLALAAARLAALTYLVWMSVHL